MENKLIWLDLEMTGLEPQSERIIEIFTAITNEDLTEVIEGPNLVISQSNEYLDNMDDWNQDHHSKSGLLDEVKQSEISQEDAEIRTLNFIKEHVGKNKSPLCGNTIHHDRKFLTLYMPQLEEYFHYRNIDVSSFKEVAKRWRPEVSMEQAKQVAHRARADVFESINELRFYRDEFFAKKQFFYCIFLLFLYNCSPK